MNKEEFLKTLNKREVKMYRQGRKPSGIKAAIEYLIARLENNYAITLHSLAQKYTAHEITISKHVKNIAKLTGLLPELYEKYGEEKWQWKSEWKLKTDIRYGTKKVKRLHIKCPYCDKSFYVSFAGRYLEEKE